MIDAVSYEVKEDVAMRVACVPSLEPPLFDSACLTLRAISHLLANLLMPVREYPILIKTLLDEASPAHDLIGHLGMTSDRLEELNTALVQLCHGTEGEGVCINVRQMATDVLLDICEESGEGITSCLLADAVSVAAPFSTLYEAMKHLCRNAVAAMPDGGELRVETELLAQSAVQLRFDRAVSGDCVAIAVQDAGTGLAPGVQDGLFEPFVAGRGDGLGVGLSVVYRAALCAGGFVAYGSRPHGGARFEMILPVCQCDGGGLNADDYQSQMIAAGRARL